MVDKVCTKLTFNSRHFLWWSWRIQGEVSETNLSTCNAHLRITEKKQKLDPRAIFFLYPPYFRIAANEPSFMSMQLKILDQRHKQKLNLKALDAVLFGPPLREYPVYLDPTLGACSARTHTSSPGLSTLCRSTT